MATTARASGAAPFTATFTARARRWRQSASTRVRIFGWYVVLLLLALGLGLVILRSILLSEVNNDVEQQLTQEVGELEQLSMGRDPESGQPFGTDVGAIFTTFLSRNIPGEGEALFTIVDGAPFASTSAPVQLLERPDVFEEWARVTTSTRGELKSTAGEVRYIAVPVAFDG